MARPKIYFSKHRKKQIARAVLYATCIKYGYAPEKFEELEIKRTLISGKYCISAAFRMKNIYKAQDRIYTIISEDLITDIIKISEKKGKHAKTKEKKR